MNSYTYLYHNGGFIQLILQPPFFPPEVGAILHTGQPSVTTLGVGDLLFGKRVPAGRMVQTIYPEEYQHQISIFDFNMRPGPSPFPRPDCQTPNDIGKCPRGTNPGRTHRFYTGKAVVPFGFGLSYTTFKYTVDKSAPRTVSLAPVRTMLQATLDANRTFPSSHYLSDAIATSSPLVNYEVQVTNTGKVDADDVVLGFLSPPGAGTNGVPLQTLFGFERVHIKAGETKTVYIYPALTDFTLVDKDGARTAAAGDYSIRFGVAEAAEHGMGFAEVALRAE